MQKLIKLFVLNVFFVLCACAPETLDTFSFVITEKQSGKPVITHYIGYMGKASVMINERPEERGELVVTNYILDTTTAARMEAFLEEAKSGWTDRMVSDSADVTGMLYLDEKRQVIFPADEVPPHLQEFYFFLLGLKERRYEFDRGLFSSTMRVESGGTIQAK